MRRMTDLTSERFSVDHKFDSFANCKCKLDTCTVELSESEHRSGWKPLASVLGDAAAAFGCVNRVEELVKQFLRGTVSGAGIQRPLVFFDPFHYPANEASAVTDSVWFPRTLSVSLVGRFSTPCRVSGFPALAALSGRCAAL